MTDQDLDTLAMAIGRPAAGLTVEPVDMPGQPGCEIVRVKTGETEPAGIVYALRSGAEWLTFRSDGAIGKALSACGDAPAASLATLATWFSAELAGYRALSEPGPGFVARMLKAAGWTFEAPALSADGDARRLSFLALGRDGAALARVEVRWSARTAPTVTLERAPR